MIALALLGFILMDAFSGGGGLFGGGSSAIGKINGKKIDVQEFSRELTLMTRGQANDEQTTQRAIGELWNYKVTRTLMEEEFEKLGITVSEKEMSDMLYVNPSPYIQQNFGNPQTGEYNPQATAQTINQIRRGKNEEYKTQLKQVLDNATYNRLAEKYLSLLTNSINVPKWFVEKQNADRSRLAKISFVAVPYASIPDSSVKVSDKEIQDYIDKHEDEFERKSESRGISYVLFNAAPTSSDTLAIRTQLEDLKAEFETTTEPDVFIQRNGSNFEYDTTFRSKSELETASAGDSTRYPLFTMPKGGVLGPYVDRGPQGGPSHMVLAKKVDEKVLPDSAKVRHILISTTDPRSGTVIMDDSTAKAKADSIFAAIKGGANFDTLAKQYSGDPSSALTGGLLSNPNNPATNYFNQGQMVPEFNNFSFEKPVGTRDIVKTAFGYHIMEVLDQKGQQPYYKIAYLAKPIVASGPTEQDAQNAASDFASNVKDVKSFDEQVEKNLKPRGINKLVAPSIGENDYQISGVGTSRELVKSIYKADKGDVVQSASKIGHNYVVAIVTDIYPEGTMTVEEVRPVAEPALRNKKKAELLRAKVGKITTLEAASTALGQPVQTVDSLRQESNVFGFDYRPLGASFNPENKGKVIPEVIEGQQGVYVIRVDDITTTPIAGVDIAAQRKMEISQNRQRLQQMMSMAGPDDYSNPMNLLKKDASIKDYRSRWY